MTLNQPTANNKLSRKNWQSFFEPKPAWRAILGLVLMIVVLLFTVPRLLIPLFPLGSVAVGIFLYRRYPVLYVGFTWWMWFVGIFVKRLIDFRCNFITPFPYHLTPLLVTSISILSLARYLPKTYKNLGLPFFLCCLTVFYGFFIGLIRQPTTDYERELIILFNWLSPICFGFHILVNWRDYPRYRQLIQKVFLWGVIVMSVYGLFQFVVAPGWDRFFLVNTPQFNPAQNSSHMGSPKPFGIRIWSTMGNSGTFAFNLAPALLLLFFGRSGLRYPAGALGFLVLLLTKLRTAWYSMIIMILVFLVSLKERYQIRAIVVISLLVLVIVPLANIEPFASVIGSRFESFSDLGSDSSLQSRLGAFERGAAFAVSEFIGYGLVAPGQAPEGAFSTNDNGYLVILVTFGWFAAMVYVSGLFLIFSRMFQSKNLDMFAIASRAIAFGSLARIMTSDVSTEAFSMPVWGFIGVVLAADKYFAYHKKMDLKSDSPQSFNKILDNEK